MRSWERMEKENHLAHRSGSLVFRGGAFLVRWQWFYHLSLGSNEGRISVLFMVRTHSRTKRTTSNLSELDLGSKYVSVRMNDRDNSSVVWNWGWMHIHGYPCGIKKHRQAKLKGFFERVWRDWDLLSPDNIYLRHILQITRSVFIQPEAFSTSFFPNSIRHDSYYSANPGISSLGKKRTTGIHECYSSRVFLLEEDSWFFPHSLFFSGSSWSMSKPWFGLVVVVYWMALLWPAVLELQHRVGIITKWL